MNELVVCILRKNNKILLGRKKTGMEIGNWNSAGGKIEPGENSETAVIREAQEELSIKLNFVKYSGKIKFHFGGPDVIVHFFISDSWEGVPKESNELGPLEWFETSNLPFDEMWPADRYIWPIIIGGQQVQGEVFFTPDTKGVVSHTVRPV